MRSGKVGWPKVRREREQAEERQINRKLMHGEERKNQCDLYKLSESTGTCTAGLTLTFIPLVFYLFIIY